VTTMHRTLATIAAALACALPATAGATSGGLDKCGCHNSKSAGYHCHKNLCPEPSKSPPSPQAPAPSASSPNEGKK
jgi:hypothetical protein